MLLTRVKEAYYRGVLRLNVSTLSKAWPVTLRTDGIFVTKPKESKPSSDGYTPSGSDFEMVKIADLSPEFDIRFCPEIAMAKTTTAAIRDAVMSFLANNELGRDVDESALYHISFDGVDSVIAKNVPEGDKGAWVDVEIITRLGVPYIVSKNGRVNPAYITTDAITALNPPLNDTTWCAKWKFFDSATKGHIYKLGHLSEAGLPEPCSTASGVCNTIGETNRELSVDVIYGAETVTEDYLTYPKLALVAKPADSDVGSSEEIGYLVAGYTPPYGIRDIQQDGTGDTYYKYVPTGKTILAIGQLAKLVEGRVWIKDTHLNDLIYRERKEREAKPRTVLQTTLPTTSGFIIDIRVVTTEHDGMFSVFLLNRRHDSGASGLGDERIGTLTAAGPNTHALEYNPFSSVVPNLETLAVALSRPVYMSASASAANSDMSNRSGGFSHMARAQGYGINHGGLGSWTREAPQSGYVDDFNLSARNYETYRNCIACQSVPNSFYSDVEIPFKHTTRKVRFLGNTAGHLAKAVLTNPGDVYVLDGHAWKPVTEDCVPVIDAILSAVCHAIPMEGLVDTWVSGATVSVSFFGNTRRTTISIPEVDGFVRQVVLTTPADAFVDIKKYL